MLCSLLLRELVTRGIGSSLHQHEQLTQETLVEAGDLCFTQLADLRHRGAFSTVAQTFAAVCQQCSLSKAKATRQLTQRWYEASHWPRKDYNTTH